MRADLILGISIALALLLVAFVLEIRQLNKDFNMASIHHWHKYKDCQIRQGHGIHLNTINKGKVTCGACSARLKK